jgi:hypothetical protein
VDGSGTTDGTTNGLGNLIVGYNENVFAATRTGSHNLIIGVDHEYTSFAGLVAGWTNTISGPHATVSGGSSNVASGWAASVSGGDLGTAPNRAKSPVNPGALPSCYLMGKAKPSYKSLSASAPPRPSGPRDM